MLQPNTFELKYMERVMLYKGLIQSLYRYDSIVYINVVSRYQRKFLLIFPPSIENASYLLGTSSLIYYCWIFLSQGPLSLMSSELLESSPESGISNTYLITMSIRAVAQRLKLLKNLLIRTLIEARQKRRDSCSTGRTTYHFFHDL